MQKKKLTKSGNTRPANVARGFKSTTEVFAKSSEVGKALIQPGTQSAKSGEAPKKTKAVKSKKNPEKKTSKKSKYSILLRFLIKILVVAITIFIVSNYILCFKRMSGNNMFPSIRDGDLCIFYRLDKCYVDDVVIYEDNNGYTKIGRIRGTGGQKIDFPENGGYMIDDYQPTETIPYKTYRAKDSEIEYPIVLEEDEKFILNDFRSDAGDSRSSGQIKESQIKGKLIFVLRRRNF